MIHSVTVRTNKQLDLWKLQAQHQKCAKNPAKIALRTLRVVTPSQSSQVTNGAKYFCPALTDQDDVDFDPTRHLADNQPHPPLSAANGAYRQP